MKLLDIVNEHRKYYSTDKRERHTVIYREGKSWEYISYWHPVDKKSYAAVKEELNRIAKIDCNSIILKAEPEVLAGSYKKATVLVRNYYEYGRHMLSDYITELSEQDEPTEPIEQVTGLQVFENAELGRVRTMLIKDEIWFVGKDVAEILGYAKPLNALSMHVDEDDSLKQGLTDSIGRMQETILINESGLYNLILSSKLPNAKKFKRWVTSEVLPSIRKTGGYGAALAELKNKVSKLESEIKALKNPVEMIDYLDMIFSHNKPITLEEIAEDYKYGPDAMELWVHNMLITMGSGNSDTAAELYKHKYIVSAGGETVWTQKGRLVLYEYMKKRGHLPVCERK